MKHPSNQQFFAYWDQKRAGAQAPDRSEIEPEAVRDLLPDIFVLSCDNAARFPFRVAGTRLCALLGRDLKDKSFLELFTGDGRREIKDIITVVTEEMLAATRVEFDQGLLSVIAPERSGFLRGGSIEAVVQLPEASSCLVDTASADVSCTGDLSSAELRTASGDVSVERVSGPASDRLHAAGTTTYQLSFSRQA